MASEWKALKIGDVFDLVCGYAFKSSDFRDEGVPVIKIKNVKADGVVLDDLDFVDAKFLDQRKDKIVRDGDILITMSGNRFDGSQGTWVGKVAQYRGANTFLLNQRVGILRPKRASEVEQRACAYFLASEANQHLFIAIATSSGGQANLSPGQILGAELILPPLEEQRAIAHILGTLDDKIELNRKRNETLEAMARALFQSWFVDFDPVRAKAAVRREHPRWTDAEVCRAALPTLSPEIAALFPDSFESSPLGDIPKGWQLLPLPEAINVNPSRPLRKGAIAPYLDMANMPTQGHSADEVVQREFNSGMRFMNGDTLVARITPCLENGKTAFVDFLDENQVGWGSTEYIVLRPKPPLPNEFAYCLARSADFRDFAIQSMTGSSGRQRVPAESLSHFKITSPSEPIAKLFGGFVEPLFVRAGQAVKESRTLAALRDTLLPKLISGEIRLKSVEHFIESVG